MHLIKHWKEWKTIVIYLPDLHIHGAYIAWKNLCLRLGMITSTPGRNVVLNVIWIWIWICILITRRAIFLMCFIYIHSSQGTTVTVHNSICHLTSTYNADTEPNSHCSNYELYSVLLRNITYTISRLWFDLVFNKYRVLPLNRIARYHEPTSGVSTKRRKYIMYMSL